MISGICSTHPFSLNVQTLKKSISCKVLPKLFGYDACRETLSAFYGILSLYSSTVWWLAQKPGCQFERLLSQVGQLLTEGNMVICLII